MGRLLGSLLVLMACGPVVSAGDGTATGSSGHDEGPTSSASMTSATSADASTSTGTSTSTTASDTTPPGDDDDDDTGIITSASFICHHCSSDGGGVTIECDILAQDCPEGEKCMPWANDGGGTWNATRCSPLDPDPAAIGDPCTVEGSGVSGIDDCATRAMCFGVDPATNVGTCAPLCTGEFDDPSCPDTLVCAILYPDVLPMCLQSCDPLAPDCGADTCTIDEATGDAWCMPTILVGVTTYGDDCDAPFVCNSDFLCVDAPHVPTCTAERCCTTRCDPLMPTPCPDEASGQTCLPLAADPTIGYCGFPR